MYMLIKTFLSLSPSPPSLLPLLPLPPLLPSPSLHQGVTIPSQRRWVQYYGHLMRNCLEYSPRTVLLKAIRLQGMPNMQGGVCGEWVEY